MQICFGKILIVLIFVVFCSCHVNNNKNLNSWSGRYSFEEEPIKAIADYYMVMQWSLSISKKTETYQGTLEVNGQQTFIKLLTDINGNSDSIAVLYNSRIDGTDENLKQGDTLFVLSKRSNKFKTRWYKLEPRLLENPPKECDCFIQIK